MINRDKALYKRHLFCQGKVEPGITEKYQIVDYYCDLSQRLIKVSLKYDPKYYTQSINDMVVSA